MKSAERWKNMKTKNKQSLWQLAEPMAQDWLEENYLVKDEDLSSVLAQAFLKAKECEEELGKRVSHLVRFTKSNLSQQLGLTPEQVKTAACVVLSVVARVLSEVPGQMEFAMSLFGEAADCDHDYYDHHQYGLMKIGLSETEIKQLLDDCEAEKRNTSAEHPEDAKIRKAISNVINTKDDQGNPIMTDKSQWYAIYKVLSTYRQYPTAMSTFCKKMDEFGFSKVSPPCAVNSVQQANKNLNHLPKEAPLCWKTYENLGAPYKKQIMVAEKLMNELGI